MRGHQAPVIRAKRFHEQDEREEDEYGQQQITARRHPGDHRHKERVQGEKQGQNQR
jgi:hypothetical protein